MSPVGGSTTRRAAILALLAWTQAVTLARAVRWPNDFAEAHWLLDYRFGLVRRGLPGEVLALALAPFGGAPGAWTIGLVGLTIFAGLSLVCFWLAVRIVRAADWSPTPILVMLGALSSPFVVMSAHLVGYFDHLLVLLTVAALALLARGRPRLSAGLLAVAVLVHESALVFGFPVLVFGWLLAGTEARTRRQPTPPLWPLLLPPATFAVLTFSPGLLLAPDFQDAFSRRLAAFPFVAGDMHLFVPEWLAPGGPGALTAQAHRFVERAVFPEAYGLVLPTTLVLFGYLVDRHAGSRPLSAPVVLAGAVLAPVVMHLAAWDTIRIWTYSIGTAWLGLWAHARITRAGAPGSPAVRWAAVAALVVNVVVETPLLDGQADRLALTTRLLLYLPVLAAAAVLLRAPTPVEPAAGSG